MSSMIITIQFTLNSSCVTDCEKERVTLQEGETSAFKWVAKDKLISMKKDELVTERMQRFVDELRPSKRVILEV